MADNNEGIWEVVSIDSWREFEELIREYSYRGWLFRGHSNVEWKLESSYFRLASHVKDILKGQNPKTPNILRNKHEKEIIAKFKAQAHLYLKHLPPKSDDIEWLTIMQHYGTPTRLLDMTFSPYVAMYFAVENATSDFCIYAIRHKYFSNVDKEYFGNTLYKDLIFKEQRDDKSFFIAYEPKFKNERVVAQQGVFLVSSTNYQSYSEVFDKYPYESGVAIKYVFSKTFRYEAITKLKFMNITSASLFPGLDGFCKSLKFNLLEKVNFTKALE